MKQLVIMCMLLLCTIISAAQHSVRFIIKDKETQKKLTGVQVKVNNLIKYTALSDKKGIAVINDIPDGEYTIQFVAEGREMLQVKVWVPQQKEIVVLMEKEHDHAHDHDENEVHHDEHDKHGHQHEEHDEEEHGHHHQGEEVIIRATRMGRTIVNAPTRVEVIAGEELDEKGNMKPGDIRMLLNESTGIQTQQTSATSFNAGIRIQGLDGRYTQMLRDGYPLFSGFSGSLSLLQIAPLDLSQVEVIKGAASTLYGGGAIAGLVNLVSKTPGEKREISLLANGTSAGGLDLSGFYSERYGKAGVTVFTSRNSNQAFDPADNGMTAIPKFERYTINPRLFLYGKKTTADIGVSYIKENRLGGSMAYIKNNTPGFYEKNNTTRITIQAGIEHQLDEKSGLTFKNSYSHFDRLIAIPGYSFDAVQQSSFSEFTWNRKGRKSNWVAGANILTEQLKEKQLTATPLRDYRYNTYGVFVQNEWTITDAVVLESGLRGDYIQPYGFALLPRLAAMIRITPALTTRVGGGYGYKAPTIFLEEAERQHFRNLLPVSSATAEYERSEGANWDVNYRTTIGRVGVNINQLFFYTRLNHPLFLNNITGGQLQPKNAAGYINTKGWETNLKFTYNHFKLFVGYTYTDAATNYGGVHRGMALTARHRLNNVLMYEIEGKLKLGLEAYYYDKQKLNNGNWGRSYWITGFMAEKLWENFSVFINFENFTNTRQSRFGSIYSGTVQDPVFMDIYAPVDGFVMNGGIKIRL